MAALLRNGARRVGGSVVQRTRAAFTTPAAAEERRLLTTEHSRPRPTKDLQDIARLIKERKEELYDLISSMEGTPGQNTRKNRQLLKFLSVQVKPRPDDPLWRQTRASERMKDVARATVFVSGCFLAYEVLCLFAERERAFETAKQQERSVKAASI